jgi:hypothetical protein
MNYLLVIIIILIVLAIFYLYFRNKQFYNMLESYDNYSQSSLSTYFQDTVDYDYYQTYKNQYNYAYKSELNHQAMDDNRVISAPKVIHAGWDGIWTNGYHLYAQFIQKNDELMIAFSNSSFDNLFYNIASGDSPPGNNPLNITDPDAFNYTNPHYKCPQNVFIGIGKLIKDRTVFTLTKIMCNFYINSELNLRINELTGKLVDKTITLYPQGLSPIQLTFVKPFGKETIKNMNKFKDNFAPLVTLFPSIPTSEYVYEEDWCSESGGQPCKFQMDGISQSTYTDINFNACGTPDKNNVCQGDPKCVIFSPAPPGYNSCKHHVDIYDYMNHYAIKALSYIGGNNIQVCDYLNYFGPQKCNACIMCYVTNVGEVLTLNYEYLGKLPGQSSLTVQRDIMYKILNDKILPQYRSILENKESNNINALNAISFTNCLENNTLGATNLNRLKSSMNPASVIAKNYKINTNTNYNDKLAPAVWQFNYNSNPSVKNINTQDSCPIILSSSQNYNTPVKYAEFYDNGKTGLTLHNGGINQQLFLENINIIKKSPVNSFKDSYITLTANIRVNNRLYLVPTKSTSGFSNSSISVDLIDQPEEDGKWLIFGFSINTLADLNKILKNIQNYFP